MNFSEISWIFFLTMVFETVFLSSSLTGDHVCSRVENYTITSYETYTEPVVVNTFTWCLAIPPRCPKTRIELRKRYRIKTEQKSKIVKECCEGYKMPIIYNGTEMDARCSPLCVKCLAGVCIAPNKCQCDPGYHGDDCAHGCPPNTWGLYCMEVCNCNENSICDPINGACQCSPGLQGPQCQEHCAIGQWGPDCANKCTCQNRDNNCDAVTGRCTKDDAFLAEQTSPAYLRSSTTKTPRINNMEYTEDVSAPRETTERQTEDMNDKWNDTNYISETTSPATASIAIPPQKATNETRQNLSTTARPVIVLVSVPERRRDVEKDKQKFATRNAFLRHVENESIDVPNIDYVKTVHKDDIQTSTSIPLDIALIVVAAIVSLGLTSLAVVMVLHMRSKLFETVRLAIYDDKKTKNQECVSVSSKRLSTVVNTSLPPPPIRVNSIFATNTEPETILTVDGIESLNTYANGAATIGLRISGNLRDLLQDGHYDRPSATLIRLQTNFDHNTEHTEHVYDEIPLQTTPLSNRKDM
ncbi:uncharacterized protein LOC105258736 isoform X1 [Camponotus floridanus]|uniref:uncharacterized protein LOC105258736 isoform X1 n=2 Tax=Camponotus floridanus TaxID=104421 RepID=UPI00059DE03B|nr:uncharacterized protein LOC105258736 isoform X1 [Camponotus floridanus]XP_025267943.1 uncharacterized protein LOC105258736 isoform X1 [Camponotus floridanus]